MVFLSKQQDLNRTDRCLQKSGSETPTGVSEPLILYRFQQCGQLGKVVDDVGTDLFQPGAGLVPAGVQHTDRTNGCSHRSVVVGVADHHAGRRINAGAAQIVGAKLYLAYAVNVRKAEQLGKKALQTPADTCSIR